MLTLKLDEKQLQAAEIDRMKKTFIDADSIIRCVVKDGHGEIVYKNNFFCGIVDSQNTLTPLDDVKNIVSEYLKKIFDFFTPNEFIPVYTEQGKFAGFLIK